MYKFAKSAALLKQTKYLALLAIFIAIKVAISSFYIPVADNLYVYFTFLFSAIEGAIFGPIGCLISGACSDIIGVIIHPMGPFFPGYTLSSMVGAFIYAMFLYDTKISVVKIGLSKLIVNYGVNVALGSLWSSMMYSKGYIYYFAKSIIKNSILLPLEIVALVLLFNVLIPFLEKKNLVKKQDSKPLPLL